MDGYWTDITRMLIPGAIAAMIAILTAVITVKLAIRRFHEERWWGKKETSYTNLLEVIHHLKNYASQHYDRGFNPEGFSKEHMRKLEDEWRRTNREYAKLRDLASLHLSDDAMTVLERYEIRKREARNEDDVFLWIEKDLEAATECLEQLKVAAKKDLKVR